MARRFEETEDGTLVIRPARRLKVGHGTYTADFRCGPHKPKREKRKGNRKQALDRILLEQTQ